jgi:hypothetical protein
MDLLKVILTTKNAKETKGLEIHVSDLRAFRVLRGEKCVHSDYKWIRFSAFSSRISFFCFGEISGRSLSPFTVLGKVESKCG